MRMNKTQARLITSSSSVTARERPCIHTWDGKWMIGFGKTAILKGVWRYSWTIGQNTATFTIPQLPNKRKQKTDSYIAMEMDATRKYLSDSSLLTMVENCSISDVIEWRCAASGMVIHELCDRWSRWEKARWLAQRREDEQRQRVAFIGTWTSQREGPKIN
jgi:hypothetical protein